ncbi:metal-sulfur cluster assembly factor [Pontibacter sp. E15-1]|uniref:metal-sulfur cluster assembly factor n=1 Tax=Pontibacter sp. E15-1 TaxID=2919918 RepID=UPI001F4FD090|nr:metal-sulfur cluster assembly factor [Pontibacter sp. E15-1]MCJ8163301.1 metal-sulfur cluster assembly factor [Pontibacter sp. E15-1]
MKMQTGDIESDVLESLKCVIDPEIGINIVDLGLVYKVSLKDNTLHIELTLTTPGCPMSGTLKTAVEQLLLKRYPNMAVEVELVWLPMWTPERITAEGVRQLGKL